MATGYGIFILLGILLVVITVIKIRARYRGVDNQDFEYDNDSEDM